MTSTVRDAMIACGVDNTVSFDNLTRAQRLATDLFSDDFKSCMDKTFEELDADFKTYSDLTAAQGQIRLLPGVKSRIKAFVQWTRDELRMGRDPATTAFPVGNASTLIRRYKTHSQFIKNSPTMAEAAKPTKFSSTTKWEDWEPTFLNYIRSIPGRDGVPLKYVCRMHYDPDPTPKSDFLDEYVANAPLQGEAFSIDSAQVKTLLVNFVSGNTQAETKIQSLGEDPDGRASYMVLKDHYEGIGVYAIDITKADNILEGLFYAGEKQPHMWWDEFERQLTYAFTSYDKREGRQVHSNEMKLRILVSKIKADFLAATKAALNIELARHPLIMTYELALVTIRNAVRAKYPATMDSHQVTRRNVREVYRKDPKGRGHGGHGRGGGRGGGRGRGGRGEPHRTRNDSEIITLKDGRRIEYHPSFKFPTHIFAQFKDSDKAKLKKQREDYRNRNNQSQSQIQQMQVQIQRLESSLSSQGITDSDQSITQGTQISQVTTGTTGTIMGGRNERSVQRNLQSS